MRRLRMMSPQGDTTLGEWDLSTSPEKLKEIEAEFNLRMATGYFAADLSTNELIKKFDPSVDMLLIPRMQGGSSGRS